MKNNYMYHATTERSIDSIRREGLKPLGPDSTIYLSLEPADAFRSVYPARLIECEFGCRERVYVNTSLYVVTIDARDLDWSRIQRGTDHHPLYYGNTVYTYPVTIEPRSLVNIREVKYEMNRAEILKLLEFLLSRRNELSFGWNLDTSGRIQIKIRKSGELVGTYYDGEQGFIDLTETRERIEVMDFINCFS